MTATGLHDAPAIAARLEAAREVVTAMGVWLLSQRGRAWPSVEGPRGQLKTAVDAQAEERLVGGLRRRFPADAFLAEEAVEQRGVPWRPASAFWTIDALDGTRSFLEGFDGFCVQAAYVERGRVALGVIHEPVRAMTYWAVAGEGAFRQGPAAAAQLLRVADRAAWPAAPVFVDSRPPRGAVAALRERVAGRFLECGSIGLKICRVAEGAADLFAKQLAFGLWDAAPGAVILQEAGAALALWDGQPLPWDGGRVYFEDLVAAPAALLPRVVAELRDGGPR